MAVAVLLHPDTPTPLGLKPAREGTGVGAVGPCQFQVRKLAGTGLVDEGLGAEPVVQIGGMNMGEEDEAGSIDKNVPLAGSDLLCSVIAVRWATDTRGPHRLTFDDRGGWLRMALCCIACERAQSVVHAAQRAVDPPISEMGKQSALNNPVRPRGL